VGRVPPGCRGKQDQRIKKENAENKKEKFQPKLLSTANIAAKHFPSKNF
jgi:hypothetical protein